MAKKTGKMPGGEQCECCDCGRVATGAKFVQLLGVVGRSLELKKNHIVFVSLCV